MSAAHRMTVTDDLCVIRLVGEVDFANVDHVSDWLLSAIEKSPRPRIEIDLAELSFLDSSGIRCFILAHRHATNRGSQLAVINPQVPVRRVLEATGVDKVLGLG